MNKRQWCPADWLDEVPPALGEAPDDFLKRNPDGVLCLCPLDPDESDGPDWRHKPIEQGAEIDFCWYEHRGRAVLAIGDDWTWSIDQAFPADTTNFCFDDNFYEMEGSIEQLVQNIREAGEDRRTFEVEGWIWSDRVTFQVRVLESGAASFVEMTAIGAGHPYGIEHPVIS